MSPAICQTSDGPQQRFLPDSSARFGAAQSGIARTSFRWTRDRSGANGQGGLSARTNAPGRACATIGTQAATIRNRNRGEPVRPGMDALVDLQNVRRGFQRSVTQPEPSVLIPLCFLNGGFPPQRATPQTRNRTTGQNQIGFAVLRLDKVAAAGALQFGFSIKARSDNVQLGVKLIRTGDGFRSSH